MAKQFVRRLCMVMAVCMLLTALPAPVLAQDVEVITSTLEQAPDVEAAASALEPELTEADEPAPEPPVADEPEQEPAHIVSFELAGLPGGIAVPYGTEEEDLALPGELTAMFSDGTTALVVVNWTCEGTYNPCPDDPSTSYTFQARLGGDYACDAKLLPSMGVAFEEVPMVEAYALDPDQQARLEEHGLSLVSEEGSCNATTYEISLYSGDFTVTADNSSYRKIYVHQGASLTSTDRSMSTSSIYVKGGTVTLDNSHAHDVIVNSGTVNISRYVDHRVGTVLANGGTVNMNGGKVTTLIINNGTSFQANNGATITYATFDGCNVDNIDATIRNKCTLKNATGSMNLYLESGIHLIIESLADTGNLAVQMKDGSRTTVELSDDVAAQIAEACWPEDKVVIAGQPAEEFTVDVRDVSITGLELKNMPKPISVTYTPTGGSANPDAGATVTYSASVNGKAVSSPAEVFTKTAKTALYLAGGTIEKKYDGSNEFKCATVIDASWVTSDGNPYNKTIENCTVTVNATVDDKNVGEGKPVTSIEIISDSGVPENMVFMTELSKCHLTANITKATLLLHGTIYRNGDDDRIDWAEAVEPERSPDLGADNLAKDESLADLPIKKVLGSDGKDLLTENISEYGRQAYWFDPEESGNYKISAKTTGGPGLVVTYRTETENPSISYYEGAQGYVGPWASPLPTPHVTNGGSGRSITYQYKKIDAKDEDPWLEAPTEGGTYKVLAKLAPYGKYKGQDVNVTGTLNITKLMWSLSLEDLTEVAYGDTITLTATVGKPDGVPENAYTDGYKEAVLKLYANGTEITDVTAKYDEAKGEFVASAPCKLVPGTYQIQAKLFTQEGVEAASAEQTLTVNKKTLNSDDGSVEACLKPEIEDGIYNGLNVDSGAFITVNASEGTKFTIQKDSGDIKELKLDISNGRATFKPNLAGKYTLTVTVADDDPHYTGSASMEVTVSKRRLTVTLENPSFEEGQPFTPEYTVEGEGLGEGDKLISVQLDRQIKDLKAQDSPHTLAVTDVTINANGGADDVSDQYDWSGNSISLTVTPKRTSIEACFKGGAKAKTMDGTWTPKLKADDVMKAALYIIRFKYTDPDTGDIVTLNADEYSVAWQAETGKTLPDAGTYTLTVTLSGDAADKYALRGSEDADTLTFTVKPLDLASDDVVFADVKPGIYDYVENSTEPIMPEFTVRSKDENWTLDELYYDVIFNDKENYRQPGTAYLRIHPKDGNINVTGEKKLKYEIVAPPKYTITIPAQVVVSQDDSMTISCTDLRGTDEFDVIVTMNSTNEFELRNATDRTVDPISYSMTRGDGTTIEQDTEVACFKNKANSFDKEHDESVQLNFAVNADSSLKQGKYTDQLTFTAKLTEVTQ